MKYYFALGSYTEPILFGTGELFQGKGDGLTIGVFEDGQIHFLTSLKLRNPSYLTIDEEKRKIYTVNESKEFNGMPGGGITQVSFDADFHLMKDLEDNALGNDPCHLAISPDKTFIATANFASGSVTVFSLDKDGNIQKDGKEYRHTGHSIHPIRQKGPHAHSILFKDHKMYVPDLGLDTVKTYNYQKDVITPDGSGDIKVQAGRGPRYGEFSRDGKHFYLINEISSEVTHFLVEKGHFTELASVYTLPEDYSGENICSDLHLTANERFLYASNRGHDSLTCYLVDAAGELHYVDRILCGGRTPRNFAITPDDKYILVGNQDSDSITVFRILTDGKLEPVNQVKAGSPVCIRFFDLDLL